jgi:hypothetical protein
VEGENSSNKNKKPAPNKGAFPGAGFIVSYFQK